LDPTLDPDSSSSSDPDQEHTAFIWIRMTKRLGATSDNRLKNAISAIFQKSADWPDWPCPVSAALQNASHDFFFSFIFKFSIIFLKYETIVRSSV
jgi:hypothetical protein